MFLNASMLFGTLAMAVPIVIHLLNRRRFERVPWAAMRFLKASVEQNQRRLRMEDLLLLLLRCLLVALLALALARPVIRAATAAFVGQPDVAAVIVLDNSASMSANDGVVSRFEQAKSAAGEAIGTLPAGSSVAVLLASDTVEETVPEPTHDLTLAGRLIEEAPLFDRGTNLAPAIKRAAEVLSRSQSLRKEIYVITDGQASGWRQAGDVRDALEPKKGEVRTQVLLVGGGTPRNLGVASARLEGMVPVGVPVRMDVEVRNYGGAGVVDVPVSISIGTEPPMDEATIPSIPAGESRTVSLFARVKAEGYHAITARVPEDHVPADDRRTTAVRAVKDVRVLLVDGETGAEARDAETFFLRNALRPVPRAEWEEYYVKVTVKAATELDGLRFDDFDAVVAANVTDLSPGVTQQVANYVRGGGALWIFPGDNIDAAFYNGQLLQKHGLLPAALGEAEGDAQAREKHFTFQDKGYDHEIVNLWRGAGAGSLTSARIYRRFVLAESGSGSRVPGSPGEAQTPASGPGGRVRVVVRYGDNRPAVMERDYGLGRVILFSTSADTEWNDLGARAGVFIPLVQRTLGYLVARQDEHLTVRAGEPFVHVAPVEMVGKDAVIHKAPRAWAGRENDEVRESRRIELVNGVPTLQYGPLNFAGAYEAKVGDGVAVRFAAQADPAESDLTPMTPEQRDTLDGVARVGRWTPGGGLAEEVEKARVGTELWLPLAAIALGLATMETMLAHWFSQSK